MIDLSFSSSSALYYEKLNKDLAEFWGRCAEEPPRAMRFTEPLAICSQTLLTYALRISSVVEPFFKGLANLLGAWVGRRGCSAPQGKKQLLYHLPKNLLEGIFQILFSTVAVPFKIGAVIYDPQGTHLNNLKQSKQRLARISLLQNVQDKKNYEDLPEGIQKDYLEKIEYEYMQIRFV